METSISPRYATPGTMNIGIAAIADTFDTRADRYWLSAIDLTGNSAIESILVMVFFDDIAIDYRRYFFQSSIVNNSGWLEECRPSVWYDPGT